VETEMEKKDKQRNVGTKTNKGKWRRKINKEK
jgi:hypothetical protein